jgi:succinate dehydrogenase / fumarate reductase flavoprotein subunit
MKIEGVEKMPDHVLLHLEHIDAATLHKRLPGISETAKIFAGVDLTERTNSRTTDCSLQYGWYSYKSQN